MVEAASSEINLMSAQLLRSEAALQTFLMAILGRSCFYARSISIEAMALFSVDCQSDPAVESRTLFLQPARPDSECALRKHQQDWPDQHNRSLETTRPFCTQQAQHHWHLQREHSDQRLQSLDLGGHAGRAIVDASGKTAQTILVVDSTDVVFRQLTIDGGLVGVQCDSFSVCRFSGDVVANGLGGIQITQSRRELDGTLVRHTDNGLTSLDASSVRIDGGVTLDGNGTGVVVDGGSSFESFGATISNSSLAGIEVSEHAFVALSGTTISGNGNGIELVRHSSLHLGATNTITANTGYGIFLFDLSFAAFEPGNSVTGNNRNGIGALDVACFPQFTATRGVFANTGAQQRIVSRTRPP